MNPDAAIERPERRLNETVADIAMLQSAILQVYPDEHALTGG